MNETQQNLDIRHIQNELLFFNPFFLFLLASVVTNKGRLGKETTSVSSNVICYYNKALQVEQEKRSWQKKIKTELII